MSKEPPAKCLENRTKGRKNHNAINNFRIEKYSEFCSLFAFGILITLCVLFFCQILHFFREYVQPIRKKNRTEWLFLLRVGFHIVARCGRKFHLILFIFFTVCRYRSLQPTATKKIEIKLVKA